MSEVDRTLCLSLCCVHIPNASLGLGQGMCSLPEAGSWNYLEALGTEKLGGGQGVGSQMEIRAAPMVTNPSIFPYSG